MPLYCQVTAHLREPALSCTCCCKHGTCCKHGIRLHAWKMCYGRVSYVATQLSHDMFHCVPPGLQQFTLLPYNAYQSRPHLAGTLSNASSLSSFQHVCLVEIDYFIPVFSSATSRCFAFWAHSGHCILCLAKFYNGLCLQAADREALFMAVPRLLTDW